MSEPNPKEPKAMTGSLVERLQLAIMNEAQLLGIHSLNLDHAESLARAAIEAMREPDDGMVTSGAEALEGGPLWKDEARDCWNAMITAAIGEKE